MSTSIQQDIQTNSATREWVPRPALREAMQRLARMAVNDDTAVITDQELTFQTGGGRTTISVEPMNVDTWDGTRIAECITIRTPLTFFKYFDEHRYAYINHFATTGAIVRDANGKDVIVSKLPLFEGEDDDLYNLYTPLIGNVAAVSSIGPRFAVDAVQGEEEKFGPADAAIPHWDEPSYWGLADFEDAVAHLREHGVYATAGQSGLSAEFPWNDGAVSAGLGHWTSLLQIRADVSHPGAGNGLFYRLELPLNLGDEEAMKAATDLNHAEVEGVDTPPFIGAWGKLPRSHALCFSGFLPNAMYKEGLVTLIAFWSMARSRFARQVIGNLTAAADEAPREVIESV